MNKETLKKALIRNIPIGLGILILLVGICALPVRAASQKTGWVTVNGKQQYYKNGKRQSGWIKVKGKYYYCTKAKGLLRNTIAGSKKHGYYYVDEDGVRVNNSVMSLAVSFAVKHSKASHTPKERLRECFDALCLYPYVRSYYDDPAPGLISSYARDMLKNQGGNCYRYASSFAYIAKSLGFDVRVGVGGTTAYRYNDLSPHGWCEIKIGKTWYIVDCSMARHNPDENLFLVARKNYPFKLRCDKIFSMEITNHKITWTEQKSSWNNLKSKKLHLK